MERTADVVVVTVSFALACPRCVACAAGAEEERQPRSSLRVRRSAHVSRSLRALVNPRFTPGFIERRQVGTAEQADEIALRRPSRPCDCVDGALRRDERS